MWLFVFLSTFSVLLEQESIAENVTEVELHWGAVRAIIPHAMTVARNDVLIADKFRVFRVSASGGEPVPQNCMLSTADRIADIAATCGNGDDCHPVVLTEGD